ncbi:ArnT family glycosyltransferase [Flavobacterium restrictum]|uniref:Glycosyltransferase family 39 protein n=1 Tax=Flavobacterium restrictum TaxID=2594428 RepID=A0A553EC03_9FLAO|nr:glycosyltransferase family 39 protein [Flavobacterium restrictum]TRX42313.1 glycosyltransferase family 39 protein [Flavobacterium restrictum]
MITKHKLFLLIAVATLVRCCIATTLNLGNDEVYYLTYAQHLQWNYFDHPPMVALLIRLTTLNLWLTNDFFVRLGSILFSGINTYLIYAIGTKIKNENTGFIAAVLFSTSIYSSIIAGVFILPDAPQLFFWMVSLWLLIEIVTTNTSKNQLNINLLLFGLTTGLCVMSKIHGVFLWLGFGLYILIYKRNLLSNVYLYLAVLLTLMLISPILFWNIDNHFITYTFHSNRVSIHSGLNSSSFFRELFGGILYNNPINYFLISITLIAMCKNQITLAQPVKRILLLSGLPLLVIILFISLFRDTLPHWSGPGFTALLLLAACFIDDKTKLNTTNISKAVAYSGVLILVVVVSGILVINYYPGTIGDKKEESLGKKDVTLDMYGWDFFKKEFDNLHQKDLYLKKTKTNFIITNKWFPGAHIDNYIAQPLHLDFVALGKLEDIHTYAWLNAYRKKIKKGDDAYFITVSNSFSNPKDSYKMLFEKINSPVIIKQYRNNKPTRNMLVYLLEGYKGE